MQDEGSLNTVITRGGWSGLDRFIYTALKQTSEFGDLAKLSELANHPLLKPYASVNWLKSDFEGAISRVFYNGSEIPPGVLEREEKNITGVRRFKIPFGG